MSKQVSEFIISYNTSFTLILDTNQRRIIQNNNVKTTPNIFWINLKLTAPFNPYSSVAKANAPNVLKTACPLYFVENPTPMPPMTPINA